MPFFLFFAKPQLEGRKNLKKLLKKGLTLCVQRAIDYHDLGDVHAVYRKDGRLLGYLTTYYGSNGRGRLAAHNFDPAPGVTVKFD